MQLQEALCTACSHIIRSGAYTGAPGANTGAPGTYTGAPGAYTGPPGVFLFSSFMLAELSIMLPDRDWGVFIWSSFHALRRINS